MPIHPDGEPLFVALSGGGAECYPSVVAVNIYQAVKQAMQDLIAPQLESLRGEITAIGANVNGLRAEMHSELNRSRSDLTGLRSEMRTELSGLRSEMHAELNGFRGETVANFARLDERLTLALDVRERIVALEARLPR